MVAACGPNPGGTASDGSTGATGVGSSGQATATTGEPGSSGGVTTGGVTTTSGTSTGGTSTDATTTTTTSDGTTEGTTSPASTGDGTTGGQGLVCAGDVDCTLHSDCCTCEGVHVFEDHEVCDEECKETLCPLAGVDAAICRFGVCITERLSCDATKVTCKAQQPDCPPGQLAETANACWTGKCVPAIHCDAVPDCALCPDDWMCVQDVGRGPQGWPRCEPVPADCGGTVDCECVGEKVCFDPFPFCVAQGNQVDCECINC
jgi:hypothetical protein